MLPKGFFAKLQPFKSCCCCFHLDGTKFHHTGHYRAFLVKNWKISLSSFTSLYFWYIWSILQIWSRCYPPHLNNKKSNSSALKAKIFFFKISIRKNKKKLFLKFSSISRQSYQPPICNVYFRHDEAFENRRFAVGGSLPQHGAAELPSCRRLVRQRVVRRWNLLGWERILRLRQNEPNWRRRFEDSRRNDAERLFSWRQLVVAVVVSHPTQTCRCRISSEESNGSN